MSQESSKPLDIVVFGATSFVGKILSRYLASEYGVDGPVKWAIAGRSQSKLQALRSELAPVLGERVDALLTIVADAGRESELKAMVAQAKVVVSTVGPYALYGEPLVKVCVEQGVDYCDLTGEAQWIKRMLANYEAQAKQTGARIVHCCGFDSVPSDMGVYFLQQQAQKSFGKTLPRVKMRVKAAKGGMSGGTVASIINLTKEAIADPSLRKELANPFSLCPKEAGFSQRQPNLKGAKFDADFGRWSAPFIMAAINTRIVHRSNALQQNRYGDGFVYDETMLVGKGLKGRMTASTIVAVLGGFMMGAAVKPTRWALERFVLPKPGEGPSEREQREGFYDIRFLGEDESGHSMMVKLTGDQDPGYGSTAKILGQAAISLAHDHHEQDKKCGRDGGFWTPASIFDERYIARLEQHAGLSFEVID